jgi:excisionase family DNA binding protein
MQQQTYSSREAATVVNVDPTTIQRAIVRGELAAERGGTSKQARYRISRESLAAWAVENNLTFNTGNGHTVDPATGEVLESPAEKAVAARARLEGYESAQLGPVSVVDGEITPEPAVPVSNVAAVVLPPAASVSADRLALLAQLVKAGHFEAAQLVIGAWGL